MRSASKTGLRKSGRGTRNRAKTEIEIKLRVPDLPWLQGQLARLKARSVSARVHEMNTLYDTADGRLARHGQMLRIRVEGPALGAGAGRRCKISKERSEISALLTFKRPARGARANQRGRYKVREEYELRIFDHEQLPRILEALGIRPWFRYEKVRSTYKLPGMNGLKLVLDETPIGLFVELEGGRREINRAARLLGFSVSDYINKSYGALFMEEHGLYRPGSHNEPHPSCGLPDMLFTRSQRLSAAEPFAKQFR
jgi:adenylate cyclase class 2